MSLKRFLKDASKPIAAYEYVVSDRFTDEKGKPLAWKLRALSAEENEALRDKSYRNMGGKRRADQSQVFDSGMYLRKLTAACVVYPDLKDKELQDSYGVMGEEKLLGTMLLAGEMTRLQAELQRINGFDMEDAVDTAKNS